MSDMRYLRGLREARERALLTQGALSEKSGVTISTISRLENGLQAARISTVARISAAVGVPAEELIDWERRPPATGGRGKGAA